MSNIYQFDFNNGRELTFHMRPRHLQIGKVEELLTPNIIKSECLKGAIEAYVDITLWNLDAYGPLSIIFAPNLENDYVSVRGWECFGMENWDLNDIHSVDRLWFDTTSNKFQHHLQYNLEEFEFKFLNVKENVKSSLLVIPNARRIESDLAHLIIGMKSRPELRVEYKGNFIFFEIKNFFF